MNSKETEAKYKIYVACHKDCYVPGSDVLFPIQVGASLSQNRLSNMLYDDSGDNISSRNKSYCELTALYWAWKNDTSDYVGLFHYRRFFSFTLPLSKTPALKQQLRLSDTTLLNLNISHEHLDTFVTSCDFAVAMHNVTTDVNVSSVLNQYRISPGHMIEDLQLVLEIIQENNPEIGKVAKAFLEGTKVHYYNMFFMRRDIFEEYCTWLFDILAEFDARKDYSSYNPKAYRQPGYLAERMLGIFFEYKKITDPSLKTKELPVVLFLSTPSKSPAPNFTQSIKMIFSLLLPYGSRRREFCKKLHNTICFPKARKL